MDDHSDEHATCDKIFHCNVKLYICVQQKPTPQDPDWSEVICWRIRDAEGILTMFSGLDAVLIAQDSNRNGSQNFIVPFESIDPRHFIKTHDGWLNLHLAYGFCAHDNRLVVGPGNVLQPLTWSVFMQVGDRMDSHFLIQLHENYTNRVDTLRRRAKLYDYEDVLSELASSQRMLSETADEARNRIINPIIGNDGITQCGMYDPIDRAWKFASILS